MSRRIGLPVRVKIQHDGQPTAFTGRDVYHHVQVLTVWKLATRWWDYERELDRTYYRVETADHQIFDLYCDGAHGNARVLDVCQD
jgi:hypothetical protein